MKYLSNLLQRAFPNEFIRISEVYSSDEVFNIEAHYSVRIGNTAKEFNNFYKFEQCILNIVGENNGV